MKKIAIAFGAYCLIGAVHAKQPIDAPYGYAAEVIGLTMILTDTELPGSPNLKEEQLADVGCTYQVTNPELVSEVLKIVDPGIYGVSTVPVRLRHAIYISMRNTPGAKYLFAEGQGTRGTVGSIEATVHAHPVYYFPRRDVPDQLRAWARAHIAEISFTPPKSDPTNPCTFAP
jgi:hypothetical protein